MTTEQMCITLIKYFVISSRVARSIADLVAGFSKFHDDRPYSSGRSSVCHVGVSNEGRSSSTGIGLSNDCKWVFNGASLTLWCPVVVHFEVKMRGFSTKLKRTIGPQLGRSCES